MFEVFQFLDQPICQARKSNGVGRFGGQNVDAMAINNLFIHRNAGGRADALLAIERVSISHFMIRAGLADAA